jgi:hypothetical protein
LKDNNSESYYKEYFSGRLSVLKKITKVSDTIMIYPKDKKETFSFGAQVNMKELPMMGKRDSAMGQIAMSNGFSGIGNALGTGNILT